MSRDTKKEFFTSFDIIFCACDGVIWMMGGDEIENTGPALVLLKEWGKEIIFVSNNSMRKDKDYIERFNAIGVLDVNPKPDLTLCTETLLEKISPENNFDAVVMDINFNLTFGELMAAQQHLLNDKCVLLVGASDDRLPLSKGFKALGSSEFMNMLTPSSGQQPLVFGKPGQRLADYLLERFKFSDPSRALFIGDNLSTDITFGLNNHFQTLFVPTGAYTIDEAKKLPEQLQPDYIAKSLADFIAFFEDLKPLKEEWKRDSKTAEEIAITNFRRESAESTQSAQSAQSEQNRQSQQN